MVWAEMIQDCVVQTEIDVDSNCGTSRGIDCMFVRGSSTVVCVGGRSYCVDRDQLNDNSPMRNGAIAALAKARRVDVVRTDTLPSTLGDRL